MSFKDMQRRLKILENQSGMHSPVLAVHLVDVNQVEILGSKGAWTHAPRERISWEAFVRDYPTGEIVLVSNAWTWEVL